MGFPTVQAALSSSAPPPFCRVILIPYLLPPRGLPPAPCPHPQAGEGQRMLAIHSSSRPSTVMSDLVTEPVPEHLSWPRGADAGPSTDELGKTQSDAATGVGHGFSRPDPKGTAWA